MQHPVQIISAAVKQDGQDESTYVVRVRLDQQSLPSATVDVSPPLYSRPESGYCCDDELIQRSWMMPKDDLRPGNHDSQKQEKIAVHNLLSPDCKDAFLGSQ